jgi:hypothetical protein
VFASDKYCYLPLTISIHEESFGRLVLLGYDVTTFIPVTYQRSSLLRPSMEVSSCG